MDNSSFDLYIVRNFLDAETCIRLIAEMRRSSSSPAPTYGRGEGGVDERVRRVSRVSVSEETLACVSRQLENERAAIAGHFGVNLTSLEVPQFLCYRVGDFFVAHQDGNTGLLRLETESRRVSVSIFLNDQTGAPESGAYGGGSLVFSDWRKSVEFRVQGEAGKLVAFHSEITHEVVPITHGERYSIVSWYR